MIAALAGATTAAAQNSAYDFVKIEYPGAIYTDAHGINNSGHVVGTYQDAQGGLHGYLFDGVTYTTVDFPGSQLNFVFGIGNAGQILGTYSDVVQGNWTAWIRDAEGNFRTIKYPPDRSTDVRAINAGGKIVGSWDTGGPNPEPAHGFLLDGEQFSLMDYPSGVLSVANGINDANVISGSYFDSRNRVRGFAHHAGTFVGVDFPGAAETGIGSINNQNRLAGWMRQGTQWKGFVLSDNSFRTLTAPVPGATTTLAAAVNDSNQVVGSFKGPGCNSWCGFIATPKVVPNPPCSQTFTMTYTGGTLKLKFTLKNADPMTWAAFVVVQNTSHQLWSVSLPAMGSAINLEYPIPNFPAVGQVTGVSTFTNASGASMCADFAFASTGP